MYTTQRTNNTKRASAKEKSTQHSRGSIYSNNGSCFIASNHKHSGSNAQVAYMRTNLSVVGANRASKTIVRKKFNLDESDMSELEKCKSLENSKYLSELLARALNDLKVNIKLKRTPVRLFVNKRTLDLLRKPGHELHMKWMQWLGHIQTFSVPKDSILITDLSAPRLVLPYLGMSLADLLDMQRFTWLEIFRSMLKALNKLHTLGYCHGDAKPNNFAFTISTILEEQTLTAHILDFEFSYPLDGKTTITNEPCNYWSPDRQGEGSKARPADPFDDLFSLCVSMLKCGVNGISFLNIVSKAGINAVKLSLDSIMMLLEIEENTTKNLFYIFEQWICAGLNRIIKIHYQAKFQPTNYTGVCTRRSLYIQRELSGPLSQASSALILR